MMQQDLNPNAEVKGKQFSFQPATYILKIKLELLFFSVFVARTYIRRSKSAIDGHDELSNIIGSGTV